MLFAIDKNEIGKQREVSASDVMQKTHHVRSGRFICPECNEIVTLVTRVNAEPYFRHGNRNDTSPECDKRVDGRSSLTIYERVGLPMFLMKDIGNSFKLYIGFASLGHNLLYRAYKNCVKIKISNGSSIGYKERQLSLTPTNFYEDQTTFVPVDFVPANGQNFQVTYIGSTTLEEIQKLWSDYADGFSNSGAIFRYSESGGKKVRRGDSITTNEDYYVVTKRFSTDFPEVSINTVGTIYLNNQAFYVYVIRINISTSNPKQFKRIEDYFKSAFGVWLLEKVPELITLWPPVTDNDGLVPAFSTTRIYCSAISGNDIPQVYTYSGASSLSVPVRGDAKGNHTVLLPFHGTELVASVDRKYVGREIVYKQKSSSFPGYKYSISISDNNGDLFDISYPLPYKAKAVLYVSANTRMELYRKTQDERYNHISIRNPNPISIQDIGINENLFVYTESRRIFHVSFRKPDIKAIDQNESMLVENLILSAKGVMLPIPYWVRQLIIASYGRGYRMFCYTLKRMISSDKLQIGIIRYLTEIKGAFLDA